MLSMERKTRINLGLRHRFKAIATFGHIIIAFDVILIVKERLHFKDRAQILINCTVSKSRVVNVLNLNVKPFLMS